MRKLTLILIIITFLAVACNNSNNTTPNKNDSIEVPDIVHKSIDSSKKSNFHYFADGTAAPDYNQSINDFREFLTKKIGVGTTSRTFFFGKDREIVTEIYNQATGDFLGFSGDTAKLDWRKLEGQHLTKKLKKLIALFGPEDAYIINKGNVSIGMTTMEALESWGKPNDINQTISESGTHEQWVYDDNYLYFDNGKLTTIQN